MVHSLQESLDSKQNLLPETNALVIQQITKIDQILNSKVHSSIVYTQSEIENKLKERIQSYQKETFLSKILYYECINIEEPKRK